MSRTDHHRPYRIRAADPTEPRRYARHWHGAHGDVPCNIGSNLDPGYPSMSTFWRRHRWTDRADCAWELPGYPRHRPGRVTTRLYGWGPQRAAERTWAHRVRTGDWEAEPPEGRTRHSVLADWW